MHFINKVAIAQIVFKRDYKKKALAAHINEIDKSEALSHLMEHVNGFLENIIVSRQGLFKAFDIYLEQNKFIFHTSALWLDLESFNSTRSTRDELVALIELFYGDTFPRYLSYGLFQTLLNYESFLSINLNDKEYKPSLRRAYLYNATASDFLMVFRQSLNFYLKLVSTPAVVEENIELEPVNFKVDVFSQLCDIIEEDLQFHGLKEGNIFKAYTTFNDNISEIKWLIRRYIKGSGSWLKSVKLINDNGFLFFADVYQDFPTLHKCLTYEFIQTGDVLQALLNTMYAFERSSEKTRAILYRLDTKMPDKSNDFNSYSKFLHNIKVNNILLS